MAADDVVIVEVAPRDGFQSIVPFIPTEQKLKLIRRLRQSGLERMEIGSFVNPRILPQMSDIDVIVAELGDDDEGEFSALVPNRKGAENALRSGVGNLVYVFSISETHNRANVRRSVDESIGELHAILEQLRPRGRFRLDISTAFHCPFEGEIAVERLLSALRQIAPRWPEIEICLCDTTGRATPDAVAAAFDACREEFGDLQRWAYHPHDTYGFGLASVMAAYQAGIRMFDAASGGLGGCPFAPGASGNLATEDIVYLLETCGISTSLDFAHLIGAARMAASLDGAVSSSRTLQLLKRRDRSSGQLAEDPLLDRLEAR